MTQKESVEVADIFRKHGYAYRVSHKMPLNHIRTMRAIERCRTAEPPFKDPETLLDYLGRYTHRIAINNQSSDPQDGGRGGLFPLA